MAAQWQRDPKTLDYIVVNGAPVNTAAGDLKMPALLRLRTRKGRYLYDPELGSKLREVRKNTLASSHGVQLTETLATQALQPIVDDGRALDVVVQVVEQGRAQGIGFIATITGKNGQEQTIPLPSVR